MAFISEETSKPVVVRVKRKSSHSKLDAFWLEINERPLKRRVPDFDKLSLDDNYSCHEQESKAKRVLVHHIETVGSSQTTLDVVQSFMYNSAGAVTYKPEIQEQKQIIKRDTKHEELLSKGISDQQVLAQNARFEQIWRRRRGSKPTLDDKLHGMCHFYDVVRVHDEEGSDAVQEEETMSLEDQRILDRHLPIPRDCIPSAIAEIESDIYAYMSEQGYEFVPRSVADIETDMHRYLCKQDDYVYDYYTVKDGMDIGKEDAAISSFPVLQVEEEDDGDFYNGPDHDSEYDSEDSNVEAHPQNDYPDETSEESASSTEEEEEEEDSASIGSKEEQESNNSCDVSSVQSPDDAFRDNDDDSFDFMDINEDLREMDINKDS
ncbi:RNA-directed DNA methylation 4-like isoform X2 [Mercurialis annua]|uniref:RNA-directed DNA methylation 4-like isoform X2 n=1 Tax=Mercurialis annua TaxID=3986 RepID=UPI00215F9B95|nr:RNA-directed DNA methylation 4-like isoform X2 [Mercurialis annua]